MTCDSKSLCKWGAVLTYSALHAADYNLLVSVYHQGECWGVMMPNISQYWTPDSFLGVSIHAHCLLFWLFYYHQQEYWPEISLWNVCFKISIIVQCTSTLCSSSYSHWSMCALRACICVFVHSLCSCVHEASIWNVVCCTRCSTSSVLPLESRACNDIIVICDDDITRACLNM